MADLGREDTLSSERVPEHSIETVFGVNPWRELERMRARFQSLERQLNQLADERGG